MQKILTLCFTLLSLSGISQKYAIIDRYFKKPIVYTDTINKGKTPIGLVVFTKDLDTLTSIIGEFRSIKELGMNRTPLNAKEYSSDNIETTIISVTKAYGDSYDITITVTTDVSKHAFKICESRILLPDNQNKIRSIYNYLKKGKPASSSNLI